MNFAGVIKPNDHAKVHIGLNYSATHSYLGSSCYLADSNLTETDRAKLRAQSPHRRYTSPYEDRKNRNLRRADDLGYSKSDLPLDEVLGDSIEERDY
ncbi:hypothetical protein F4825DRAFT_450316 [Nemania diffusa]|nr:hypothetical protein F4825DRAFT_450316 [Nemania diffusa]